MEVLVWDAIARKKNPEIISDFLAKMPVDQQNNLNLIFKRSREILGSDYEVSRSLLVSQMSPAERMRVFALGKSYSEEELKFYTPVLQRLGHSEAEIQQMLPASKKE